VYSLLTGRVREFRFGRGPFENENKKLGRTSRWAFAFRAPPSRFHRESSRNRRREGRIDGCSIVTATTIINLYFGRKLFSFPFAVKNSKSYGSLAVKLNHCRNENIFPRYSKNARNEKSSYVLKITRRYIYICILYEHAGSPFSLCALIFYNEKGTKLFLVHRVAVFQVF